MEPIEICRLEENRQARGCAEAVLLARKVGTPTADYAAEEIAGGMMVYGGKHCFWNQAMGLGLHGPVSGAEIDRLIAFFEGFGVAPKLEVATFAHESLLRALAERGFIVREFEHVLARELRPDDDFAAILPHPWPAGLSIERVDPADETAVMTMAAIATRGFMPELSHVPEAMLQSTAQVLAHPRCTGFIAKVDGTPVAQATMEAGEQCAGLFGAAVLPDFRQRGIQAALIAERMKFAAANGCKLAAIHSRPGIPTERNAARLGFALAYAKVIFVRPGEGLQESP